MSTLLRASSDQLSSTSAFGAMRHLVTHSLSGSRIFMIRSGTTASRAIADQELLAIAEITTSGITLPSTSSPEATQKSLSELRRLSGLTWDQLAKLFNVSRRSLHFWASGQPLSRSNEDHLNRLLGTIRYIDRGSASLNRSLLLRPDGNGNPLFDLLIACKYEEFKQIAGAGNALQKPESGALSEEERRMRMPLPPDVLANPLPDISYRQTGKSKPARAVRSRRNSSGQ